MSTPTLFLPPIVSGTLHMFVSFDWGQEIDLVQAGQLAPAEPTELARRRRTPSSIGFRPAPLRFDLPSFRLELSELGAVDAQAEATLFDFAAVSLAIHVPFELASAQITKLAGALAQPEKLVAAARTALEPLRHQLLPAIRQPDWSAISEEYFVFHLTPTSEFPSPEELLRESAAWLASLVRLEAEPLSTEEIAEALRQRISYSPTDLLVSDWSATVLVDRECDETLQTIEFANVQLLELRHIDARLDERLEAAYQTLPVLS